MNTLNGIKMRYKELRKKLRKKLFDTSMQINIVEQILARQSAAVNALMKVQLYGITEDQILKLCRSVESKGHDFDLQPINSQINLVMSRHQPGSV
jgi:ferritin-like metal-binding protein YciE